jgi:hypothetical protein
VSEKNLIHEQFFLIKLKAGDPDVFAEIFSTYYKDMVMFAFSFIRDLDSAEEIVQDVFVKLSLIPIKTRNWNRIQVGNLYYN